MCNCICGFTGDTCDIEGTLLFSGATLQLFPRNLPATLYGSQVMHVCNPHQELLQLVREHVITLDGSL